MRSACSALLALLCLAGLAVVSHADPFYRSSFGTPGNGPGQFGGPDGIAVSQDGFVYVADTYNSRVQKFTKDGAFVSSFGSYGTSPGQFSRPYGIDVDGAGNVYVGDLDRKNVQKFGADGSYLATIGAGAFQQPFGLWVGADGVLYVTDRPAGLVRRFQANGAALPSWGGGVFLYPQNIEGDGHGQFYVSDGNGAFRVVMVDANGQSTGSLSNVGNPTGAALTAGQLYLTEYNLNQVAVFDRATNTQTFTITDGGGMPKESPLDCAVMGDSVLYVLDTANGRVAMYGLTGGQPPQVTVVSPNGGEQLTPGQQVSLSWSATDDGTVASVALDVSRDGGASYQTIASGLPNSGAYAWTVTGPVSANCLLRVRAIDDVGLVGSDVSDATWAIAGGSPPQVTVISPNGGETLKQNHTATLEWSATDDGSIVSVSLDVSRDGGATYTPIATGVANTGSYVWTVTGPASPNCRLRVRATDNDSLTSSDASDADWSIVVPSTPPQVQVISPNGGETFEVGSTYTLQWSANDPDGSVASIQLAIVRDGATEVIANGLPNTGSYSWTADLPASLHCRLMVLAVDDDHLGARDSSDGYWTIETPPGSGSTLVTFLDAFGSTGAGPGQFGGPDGIAASDDGSIYVADTYNSRVQKFTAAGAFVASFGTNGNGPGQFQLPYGIDVDAHGNVYVSDLTRHDVQKFTADGTWLATFGADVLVQPFGLWVSDDGVVYVTDRPARVVRRFSTDGTALGDWGPTLPGGYTLAFPQNIEGDGHGAFYISDGSNAFRVVVVNAAGEFQRALGGGWIGNPTGSSLALGHLFLTEYNLNRVSEVDLANGLPDGTITDAGGIAKYSPLDDATVGDSLLYVLDTANGRVNRFRIESLEHPQVTVQYPNGGQQWYIGALETLHWSAGGPKPIASADLELSRDGGASYEPIATGAFAGAYDWTVTGPAADSCLLRVTVHDTDGNTAVDVSDATFSIGTIPPPPLEALDAFGSLGSGPGQFGGPDGVAVSSDGFVYVADTYNSRVQKFTTEGAFVAVIGGPGTGPGQFTRPYGIAVDAADNIYVGDFSNLNVQKFDATGAYVATIADATVLQFPLGLWVDDQGILYVTDRAAGLVRRFTTSGDALGSWGSGSGLIAPQNIEGNRDGLLFVSDGSPDWTLRVLNSNGTPVATYPQHDGNPTGAAMLGNFVVLSVYNTGQARVLGQSNGVSVQTLVSSNGISLSSPIDVATLGDTLVYIADAGNARIVRYRTPANPPQIAIGYPHGGESFMTGAGVNVQWTTMRYHPISSVRVSLSRDGGSTYEELGTLPTDSGAFEWNPSGPSAQNCRLRIQEQDATGYWGQAASSGTFTIVNGPTSVPNGTDAVRVLALETPYPSPVRSDARIGFALPHPGHVRLTVIDVQGREVARLVDSELPAGRHDVQWRNSDGRSLASGIYFLRLDAGRQGVLHRRLVLAR